MGKTPVLHCSDVGFPVLLLFCLVFLSSPDPGTTVTPRWLVWILEEGGVENKLFGTFRISNSVRTNRKKQ